MKQKSNTTNMKQTANKNNRLFAKHARPKMVTVMLERGTNGSYHVIGAEYLDEVNQYRANWRSLDARDVASELKRAARTKSKLTVN